MAIDPLIDLPSPTLTRLAAQRLHELAGSEYSPEVRRKVGLCLLDYIGAYISGLSAPWAPVLLSYAQSRQGAPEAHLWGSPVLVAAEVAAFVNGALGHSIIRDDMHLLAGSHIGVMVISAAMALAQHDNWFGRDLVHGLMGGYEMAMRLGVAVRSGGTFMCRPWASGQEICTYMGTAAHGGIAAFDLARAGMHSSESILEGRDGLLAAYGAGVEGVRAFKQSLMIHWAY